jgi:hypothetical protein
MGKGNVLILHGDRKSGAAYALKERLSKSLKSYDVGVLQKDSDSVEEHVQDSSTFLIIDKNGPDDMGLSYGIGSVLWEKDEAGPVRGLRARYTFMAMPLDVIDEEDIRYLKERVKDHTRRKRLERIGLLE